MFCHLGQKSKSWEALWKKSNESTRVPPWHALPSYIEPIIVKDGNVPSLVIVGDSYKSNRVNNPSHQGPEIDIAYTDNDESEKHLRFVNGVLVEGDVSVLDQVKNAAPDLSEDNLIDTFKDEGDPEINNMFLNFGLKYVFQRELDVQNSGSW